MQCIVRESTSSSYLGIVKSQLFYAWIILIGEKFKYETEKYLFIIH